MEMNQTIARHDSCTTKSLTAAREDWQYAGVGRPANDVRVMWKGLCDFLLLLNRNLSPISHHFRDITYIQFSHHSYNISAAKKRQLGPLPRMSFVCLSVTVITVLQCALCLLYA